MRLVLGKVIAASAAAVLAILAAAPPLALAFVATPRASLSSGATIHLSTQGGSLLLGRKASGVSVPSRRQKRRTTTAAAAAAAAATSARMSTIAGPEVDAKVVICGPRDGIAGLVAQRLSDADAGGGLREVLLADSSLTLEEQLAGAKVVVGSSDGGPDGEEAPPGLTDEIVAALPSSTEYLIWVDSPEGRRASKKAKAEIGMLGEMFGQGFKESLEAVRSVEGDVKCVVVHAGALFGASIGEEPVPFLTGPKAEPVLNKSITRQAVLVGPGTVLSSPEDATTKRSSVAEAIERFINGPERKKGVELSVVSVEGFATTDEEWQEELNRLDNSEGVAVFSIDFKSVERKDLLIKWLSESWGPAALRKSTAAMLRSGARPVALTTTPDGVDLVWETLAEDLTAVQAGKLSIVISDEPAGIRVVRVAGKGQPQGKSLSGEEEIVQGLLQGINTVAYPKSFVKRKIAKVSLKAAAAAMTKAGVVAPSAKEVAAREPDPVEVTTTTAAAVVPPTAAAVVPPAKVVGDQSGGQTPPKAPAPAPAAPRKGRGRRSGGKRKSS